MNTITVKVSELTGAQLDWAVAVAGEEWKKAHEHFPTITLDPTFNCVVIVNFPSGKKSECVLVPANPFRQDPQTYSPSTNWAHGGPIIEREKIIVLPPWPNAIGWYACIDESFESVYCHYDIEQSGDTPLEAAMRAFVASKLGDEVEVPA